VVLQISVLLLHQVPGVLDKIWRKKLLIY
jgi:hypothetical protein